VLAAATCERSVIWLVAPERGAARLGCDASCRDKAVHCEEGNAPVHQLDLAAANPCPFCNHMLNCPRAMKPRDECLEFWPLSAPEKRALRIEAPWHRDARRAALSRREVRDVIERWEAGEQVADDDYLMLREGLNRAAEDQADVYWYVLSQLLRPHIKRLLLDAVSYYRTPLSIAYLVPRAFTALKGAIVVASEAMVRGDTSVRVPSHFERIVLECLKYFLFGLTGQQLAKLPRDARHFKSAVEQEWREVLGYGNGFYGFTVIPRVSILDLVRYQQLGGGDDLVSWSIGNWVLWTMTAFPVPVQLVVPGFKDKALKARLKAMYEPLVHSFAWRLRKRAKVVLGSWRDVPGHEDVLGELRALLDSLIDEYDFMYGKPEAQLSSVGAIGWASSPELRERLDRQLKQAGLPISSRDLVHVGFARYVAGKFEEHLRQHYPIDEAEFGDAEKAAGTLGEADSEEAEAFMEDSARTKETSDVGKGVPVALEREGTKYLYLRQMTYATGIEMERLRTWMKRGYLPDLRVRDIDPGAARRLLNRRVLPWTNEMIERIDGLASEKRVGWPDSAKRLYSLGEAAALLGIDRRTLYRWRKKGRLTTVKVGGKIFVSGEELQRLGNDTRTDGDK
jgi:excisionase family DNA binding protein